MRLVQSGLNTLRIDAIGEQALLTQDCAPTGLALKTINTINPDSLGNISILAQSSMSPQKEADLRQVLRIDSIANGLQFSLAR